MASTPLSGSTEGQPENQPAAAKTEIRSLTKAGRELFYDNKAVHALAMFKKAYVLSRGTAEPHVQAGSLFNLGAAYIATGKPKKGLKCLWKVKEAGALKEDGDLYFNMAAAYDDMREYAKAAEFYGKAVSQYDAGQTQSPADALIKLAYCLVSTGELASAALAFRLAGRTYQKAQQVEEAAMAMREAANYFLRSRTSCHEEVLATLWTCDQLCAGITNQALLGKLYNHLGLHYAEMRRFDQAEEHFVEAMKLCSRENFSVRKRAVLLQNLGAIYSALERYEKSLRYHSEAADIYGALGEGASQAQCLYNLANAHSQLGHHSTAEIHYQKTRRVFAGIGDSHGEAQACEGLGTAHLGEGYPDRAIRDYQAALALFEKSKETSEISRERIREKLADAVSCRADAQSCFSHTDGFVTSKAADSKLFHVRH